MHCDRHVVKMITESVQMLVTAGLANNWIGSENLPCAPLSANMAKHPCTRWTCEHIHNFNYLTMLTYALCQEHQYRYPLSPQHAYYYWVRNLKLALTASQLGTMAPIPAKFAVAIKDSKQRSVSTPHLEAVDIYRNYYVRDKHKFATWKRRVKPIWFVMREDELISQGRL